MEGKFAQQLKKGVLDMVVLKLISEKNTYGYQILKELENEGEGFFDLKEGTLYPVLYRLEDQGWIESSWQAAEGRTAPKKYYKITEKGKAVLTEYCQTWEQFAGCVNKMCRRGFK